MEIIRPRLRVGYHGLCGVHNPYAGEFADIAAEAGFRAGADYNLVTFDDNPNYRSYDFTSMAVRAREIGEIFGRMICENAWYQEFPVRLSLRIGSELIERSSCRKLIV